jgi:drug/metabolite transporter (DMT)-like permease
MATLFALTATVLTSWLPIFNKYLLRDARPALVAWVTNAASLPLLTAGTALLTQCSLAGTVSFPLAGTVHFPHIDSIFVIALLVSVVLNWAATLLSTIALAQADASLVSPLLTFNPAFTLLIAMLLLREIPALRQTIGVGVVLLGAYLLEVKAARTYWLAPLRLLLHRPGALLALGASALWGMTTVLEKQAIEHMSPLSGPLVALLGTFLMIVLLTPGALRSRPHENVEESRRQRLALHPWALSLAVLIASVAPLFGFTAIALGLVGYVTTLFKLSAVLTILWAWLFLGEGQTTQRLLGACVMLIGGLLVAL